MAAASVSAHHASRRDSFWRIWVDHHYHDLGSNELVTCPSDLSGQQADPGLSHASTPLALSKTDAGGVGYAKYAPVLTSGVGQTAWFVTD